MTLQELLNITRSLDPDSPYIGVMEDLVVKFGKDAEASEVTVELIKERVHSRAL